MLNILYQDESLVAIDKPPLYFVHTPRLIGVTARRKRNCLFLLRDQLKRYIYPVHRLDCSTSGVLLYALDSAAAGDLGKAFSSREVTKKYHAVVRGFMPTKEGVIDRPLTNEEKLNPVPCLTRWRVLAEAELPLPSHKHPSSRYSYLEITPETGRFHQIRRHLAGLSHPIIGDAQHGDGFHNRRFREEFLLRGLFLRAVHLSFNHPRSNTPITIDAPTPIAWSKVSKVVFQM